MSVAGLVGVDADRRQRRPTGEFDINAPVADADTKHYTVVGPGRAPRRRGSRSTPPTTRPTSTCSSTRAASSSTCRPPARPTSRSRCSTPPRAPTTSTSTGSPRRAARPTLRSGQLRGRPGDAGNLPCRRTRSAPGDAGRARHPDRHLDGSRPGQAVLRRDLLRRIRRHDVLLGRLTTSRGARWQSHRAPRRDRVSPREHCRADRILRNRSAPDPGGREADRTALVTKVGWTGRQPGDRSEPAPLPPCCVDNRTLVLPIMSGPLMFRAFWTRELADNGRHREQAGRDRRQRGRGPARRVRASRRAAAVGLVA